MADDDIVAAKIRLLREVDEELRPAYNFCFNSPNGRKVLAHLIETCCGNESTCGSPIDVYETLVREGRRQVLLQIMRYANLDAEQVFKIGFKLI